MNKVTIIMLEHKVVTKTEFLIRSRRRRLLIPGAMLFVFLSNFYQFAVGAPSERAPADEKKVKTVGDVLRKIEGKNLAIKKGDSKLHNFRKLNPASKQIFRQLSLPRPLLSTMTKVLKKQCLKK